MNNLKDNLAKKFGKNTFLKLLLFSPIFILGFFLRAQEVLSNNYLFLLDMGRDMLAVKGIVFDHHLTLIGPYTSLAGVFQGPLYYYLLSVPTFLLGGNPLGALVLMLTISLLTILAVLYFSWKNFGILAAFFVFLLFSVSPEAIAAATYTWNPHPLWLLMVIYIFALFSTYKGNKKTHLILWPTIGLMFHFEAALGFFIGITTLILLFLVLRKKMLNKSFFIGILICIITFSPLILFDLRHEFLMTKSVVTLIKGGNESLFVKGEALGFGDLMVNHFNTFLGNYNSGFPSLFNFKYSYYIPIIGTAIAFFYIRRKKDFKPLYIFYKLYFSFLAIFLILLTLYPYPLRYWFFTGFQTLHIIAVGLSFSLLWKNKFGKILILLLILKLTFYSSEKLDKLYFNPPNDGGYAKVRGKISAIDYIYKDAKGEKFNLLIFTPPVLTDAYDYLIWWHGKNKYNYIPGKEKSGLFYLLVEPDPSQPWSYQGWLETVIKSGEVISTTTHASGLIIQKRIEIKD